MTLVVAAHFLLSPFKLGIRKFVLSLVHEFKSFLNLNLLFSPPFYPWHHLLVNSCKRLKNISVSVHWVPDFLMYIFNFSIFWNYVCATTYVQNHWRNRCVSMSRFRFHFPHKIKHVRQCLPQIYQFYNGISILNIGFQIKPREWRTTFHERWKMRYNFYSFIQ